MAATAAGQFMAWLDPWGLLPRVDKHGDDFMDNMVEMKAFKFHGDFSNADGPEGGLGSQSRHLSKWRRWTVLARVASLFAVTATSVIWFRKGSAISSRSGGGGLTFSKTFLPAYTMETVLRNPASPQARALKWVEQHPQFKHMPLWRRRQLMGLATLLFSDCGFMPEGSPDMEECAWRDLPSQDESIGKVKVDLACTDDGHVLMWNRPTCPQTPQNPPIVDQNNWNLPPEISLLTELQSLSLGMAYLSGSVPTELWELTALTSLNLRSNDLTGQIPGQLGRLTQLTFLALEYNQFSGLLPTQLGQLRELEFLSASRNQLTGSLPSELQDLTALTSLDLHKNQLSGPLPNLSLLTHLDSLILQDNRLGGNLSTGLRDLTALTSLFLSDNQFTGSLPTELGLLAVLKAGLFDNNRLTGTIPTQLGLLTHLRDLGLATNQLQGTLPTELSRLHYLGQFQLQDNQLVTGNLPLEVLAGWQNLYLFWIYNTSLTGTLPLEHCNSSSSPYLKLFPKVNCDRVSCPCAQCECV